jgi:hypothetical protein
MKMTKLDSNNRPWASPIAHAIDDFLDDNAKDMDVDDVNICYLAQRIIEIQYLELEVAKNRRNRAVLEEMMTKQEVAVSE